MLFRAAHADEEQGMVPEHLLANPSLARYVVGFGGEGDIGIVAEASSGPLGAAWVRLLAGENRAYGWVDDETPELAIGLAPGAVGAGIGTRLMEALLAAARTRYGAVSLSVRKDNPARRLYARFGFVPVRELVNRVGGVSETMLLRFSS